MASIEDITSEDAFQARVSQLSAGTLAVIFFHTPWAAPCAQMRTILSTLASSYPASTASSPVFLAVDAEELPEISESFEVSAVPFVALQKNGSVVDSVSGIDAGRVRAAVERHAGTKASETAGSKALPPPQVVQPPTTTVAPATSTDDSNGTNGVSSAPSADTAKEDLHARLTSLVSAAPVMLFMKGTPSAPQCGFSRQLVGLLRERGVRYGFFNILADEEVRQGLKEFADWPTFPQLWVKGELVGGLDIVKEEAAADAEFLSEFAVKATPSKASTEDA